MSEIVIRELTISLEARQSLKVESSTGSCDPPSFRVVDSHAYQQFWWTETRVSSRIGLHASSVHPAVSSQFDGVTSNKG